MLNTNFKILFIINNALIGSDPIGLMQLSAIARQSGCDVSLCLARERYLEKISQYQPDLIAVSMMSPDYPILSKVISNIKNKYHDIPIVVGGPHPTFKPEVIETILADAICVGEADIIFPEVINKIMCDEDFSDIKNIHTKSVKNSLSPLIQQLDDLPFVDRELIYDHLPAFKRFKLRSFYTSRGCPYTCSYCFNHAYNKLYRGLGKVVRKRSVNSLIEEIESVVNRYPTEFIRFSDDSFVHRVDTWLEEFVEKYRKKVNLPFYCLIRPDCVDEEMVKLLKYAGCRSVCMSIETGNEKIRKQILHRNISNERMINAFDLVNRYGINIYTNSILSIPSTTAYHDIETLNMNIRCRPARSAFSICIPYAGTNIYKYIVQHQLINNDTKERDVTSGLTDYSILTAFSIKEKKYQKNLSLLFPLVVKFPSLKRVVVQYLAHWPFPMLYTIVNFIIINYDMKKYIVPISYTGKDYVFILRELINSWVYSIKANRKL